MPISRWPDGDLPDHAADLLSLVRDILAQTVDEVRTAEVADGPAAVDARLWKALSAAGLTTMLLPEELGGGGASLAETLWVSQELARHVAAVPFLSSAVVVGAVLAAAPAAAAVPWARVMVEQDEAGVLFEAPAATVVTDGGGERLTAMVPSVVDGAGAGFALVSVPASAGLDEPMLLGLDLAHPAVRTESLPTLDPSRPATAVRCDDAPVVVVARGEACRHVLSVARTTYVAGLVWEQAAIADEVLHRTAAFVRTRHQFGQPIGAFQSVKHQLADLACDVDRAQSAVELLSRAGAAEPGGDPSSALAIAAAVCPEVCVAAAESMIHLHGGLGFTWEFPAHRYYRRALADAAITRDLIDPLDRLADAVLP